MTDLQGILMTFLVAMTPVLELRGAIPMGVAAGLPPLAALGVAIVGNMVPVPFLILFTRRIFRWLKKSRQIGQLVDRLEQRGAEKSAIVKTYAGVGLCILVAIPLPGTGAWTGALVAALMDMRLKRALPHIFVGVVIAGFLITCLTYGVGHLLG